jgi:hypothetical protein
LSEPAVARCDGCHRVMDLPGVAGGFARCRDPVIKTLPNIADDEHLPPSEIANIVRVLKIIGFEPDVRPGER